MRFFALVRKELREALPWLLSAAMFFLIFGSLNLWSQTQQRHWAFRYPVFSPGTDVALYKFSHDPDMTIYTFIKSPIVSGVGALLFLTSICLGLILAVRQFWMPGFTNTWGFELHRSASRAAILWAKFAATAISFIISTGLVWTGLYWYASQPRLFAVPPPDRVFIEGWIYIVIGLTVYFGTALSGLSRTRWYTTKMVGLAFALLIMVTTIVQWQIAWAFTTLIIGALIFLVQVFDTFLSREF
jgi:hypothetical protein